jgi:hypothetical protein
VREFDPTGVNLSSIWTAKTAIEQKWEIRKPYQFSSLKKRLSAKGAGGLLLSQLNCSEEPNFPCTYHELKYQRLEIPGEFSYKPAGYFNRL